MKNRTIVFWVSFILLSSVYSCSKPQYDKPERESTSSRLTPRPRDSFTKLMERNLANIKYMMYGYINFDKTKIIKANANIVKISHDIVKKIPEEYQGNEEDMEIYFNNNREITSKISEAFEKNRYDDAVKLLKTLVANCMTCHESYKTGISTKQVEDSLLVPRQTDVITILMDRNLANLEYLMHGFMNIEKTKVIKATENLIKIGYEMDKKIPGAYKHNEVEWKVYSNNQRELSTKIEETFKQDKYEEATELLNTLIVNCMTCHKLYKPGISSRLMSVE